MKKQLALSTIVLLSGSIYAQGVVLSCQQDNNLLFPKQALSTDESLNVVADRSEITKKDRYLLTGNVSLTLLLIESIFKNLARLQAQLAMLNSKTGL